MTIEVDFNYNNYLQEVDMFNGDIKKKALDRLNITNAEYQKSAENAKKCAIELHNIRISVGKKTVKETEDYVNELANSPKEFNKSVLELRIEYHKFDNIVNDINASDIAAKVGGGLAAAGVAAGVGVAVMGPAAALAIATTFGTASTGIAISTLSGAAATNAALAWLGGGAIVAGGGGMALGNVLLALTGPIGWGIGGAILTGSALWARNKNKKIAEEAAQITSVIIKNTTRMKSITSEVLRTSETTRRHINGISDLIKKLRAEAPTDYTLFSKDQKMELGSLVNSIESLSKILNKTIGA